MKHESTRVLFCESGRDGGSVTSLASIVTGLAPRGYDIGLLSWYRTTAPVDLSAISGIEARFSLDVGPGPRPCLGERTLGIPHPTGFSCRYLPQAWRALGSFRPDVVYLNNGIQPHLPMVAASMARRIPMVSHIRGARDLRIWEKPFLKQIARFIVLTDSGRQFYQAQGIPPERTERLYDPIDLQRFDARVREEWDPPLHLDEEAIYAIQVGALKAPKRPYLAIEAVARARAQCPELRLILAGDGSMRQELEGMVAERGLQDCVHLIGFCSQVPALLSRCHIGLLVSMSDYEGLGIVILESMAARLPFVTWKSPVMTEMVDHGRTGLVAADDSPEEIAKALVTLCKSASLRRQMGGAGRDWVASERFDPAAYTRKLDALLVDLKSRRRRSVG